MNDIFYLKYLMNRLLELIRTNKSNKFFLWTFIIGFFLFGFSGFSQVSTKIDTTKIRIGEQFKYEIIVNETEEVQFTKLKLDSLNRIGIVRSFKIDSLKNQLIKK